MREAENAGMEEKIYGGSSKGGKLKLKLSYASNTAAAEAAATVVAAATAAAATAETATTAGTAFYSQTYSNVGRFPTTITDITLELSFQLLENPAKALNYFYSEIKASS
uniref:Uncharacterized protein n=1 Tax=Vespula pensylvanica TaxID=30213 RepID=A0A834PFZ2_VESPE|nr:hypothetical protein H0235_000852 [Vespula pensylvanica]